MIGSCIIDGIDIYQNFGMFILKGGDYDFLSYPERIEPDQTNWHEHNGVECDLSEVFFNAKNVTPQFYIRAENEQEYLARLNDFYSLITKPGNREIYSREFERTFNLRFVDVPSFAHRGGLVKPGVKRSNISVLFSQDNPLDLFDDPTNLVPTSEGYMLSMEDGENYALTEDDIYFIELLDKEKKGNATHVVLNGYDLSEFGIIVSECYNSVLKLPAVKAPLIRRFARRNGLLVSTPTKNTFEQKQIVIECYLFADSRAEFYHNYEALFNNLTKTEALTVTTPAGEFLCYYSAMQGFEKQRPFSGRIRVKFSLLLKTISI